MSMFVSRSLDYALRSLIVLAQEGEETANLRRLSASASVPKSYLAKLMRTLVRAELVRSDIGTRGGYRLAKSPDEITLKEIYETVEGTFRTVVCDDHGGRCDLMDDCTQVAIWDAIEGEILDILDQRKLSDFVPNPATAGPEKRFVPLEQLHL